jgi:hypothetical protein
MEGKLVAEKNESSGKANPIEYNFFIETKNRNGEIVKDCIGWMQQTENDQIWFTIFTRGYDVSVETRNY